MTNSYGIKNKNIQTVADTLGLAILTVNHKIDQLIDLRDGGEWDHWSSSYDRAGQIIQNYIDTRDMLDALLNSCHADGSI